MAVIKIYDNALLDGDDVEFLFDEDDDEDDEFLRRQNDYSGNDLTVRVKYITLRASEVFIIVIIILIKQFFILLIGFYSCTSHDR